MKPTSVRMNIDTGEKTWLTPPNIINALGPFDLDPCCPPKMPWRTAKRMVSLPENGLTVDWTGKRVWLNPPYGREAIPFLRKMADNRKGLLLTFARTDTSSWQDLIFPYAYTIMFLRGRINFHLANGFVGKRSPAPAAIVAYSYHDSSILCKSGLQGTIVRIK